MKSALIPTRIHGLLDYTVAVILICLPWLLSFAGHNAATYTMVTSGIVTIVYSILTEYEWGAIKVIPMRIHLHVDLIAGIVLSLSPWLLGFSKYIYLPHLVMGILEVLVTVTSSATPSDSYRHRLNKRRASFYKSGSR